MQCGSLILQKSHIRRKQVKWRQSSRRSVVHSQHRGTFWKPRYSQLCSIGIHIWSAHVSSQISDSVKPDSVTRNIAALANVVIGKTRVKPTLQLYIRLAFIVSHMHSFCTTQAHWSTEIPCCELPACRRWEFLDSRGSDHGRMAIRFSDRSRDNSVCVLYWKQSLYSLHASFNLVRTMNCTPPIKHSMAILRLQRSGLRTYLLLKGGSL